MAAELYNKGLRILSWETIFK